MSEIPKKGKLNQEAKQEVGKIRDFLDIGRNSASIQEPTQNDELATLECQTELARQEFDKYSITDNNYPYWQKWINLKNKLEKFKSKNQ